MKTILKKRQDIYKRHAANYFNIKYEDVTVEQRRFAKTHFLLTEFRATPTQLVRKLSEYHPECPINYDELEKYIIQFNKEITEGLIELRNKGNR